MVSKSVKDQRGCLLVLSAPEAQRYQPNPGVAGAVRYRERRQYRRATPHYYYQGKTSVVSTTYSNGKKSLPIPCLVSEESFNPVEQMK